VRSDYLLSFRVRSIGSGQRTSQTGCCILGFLAGLWRPGRKAAGPPVDIRGGFNFYSYGTDFTKDGAHYAEDVDLRSVNLQYDKYLHAGLFISGGALVWNGNKGDGSVTIPAGQSFSLGTKTYISDPSNPVHGSSGVRINKFSPLVTLGYGNLISKGRIAYSFEGGVAFHGTPLATLSLTGGACFGVPAGLICQDIGSNAGIQNDVAAQQTKINNDISGYKYYPIIQFMIGYKFK
jgi:hypothetical protein